MRVLSSLMASCVALAMLFGVTEAQAQAYKKKQQGKLQLGLSTPLFSYADVTSDWEVDDEDFQTRVTGTDWGLANEVTGEFGYRIFSEIVLGALLKFDSGSEHLDRDFGPEDDVSSSEFMIAPKLEVMFRPEKPSRPFVSLAVGYATYADILEQEDVPDVERRGGGFRFLGRLGLRYFATESFSIDPALAYTYRADSETRDEGAGGDFDVTVRGYDVGLVIGFSGWLM